MREKVESIYANDAHVFCGQGFNRVMVYDLATGQLSRELTPGCTLYDYTATQVVGGKGIIAALMRHPGMGDTVTVWSSQQEMEQLHFFNCQNFCCPNDSYGILASSTDKTIQVVGRNKVAILAQPIGFRTTATWVVLEKVDSTWETKTLGCFTLLSFFSLASDGDWLAVLDYANKKVKLWQGNENCQDIVLPGFSRSEYPVSIFLELPHLIVGVWQNGSLGGSAWIKVYNMEDTVLCLVKSIQLNARRFNSWSLEPIANRFCLGFSEGDRVEGDTVVHMFVKKELVSAELSPDETEVRELRVEGRKVSINTTGFVSGVEWQEDSNSPLQHDLRKTDFWMS